MLKKETIICIYHIKFVSCSVLLGTLTLASLATETGHLSAQMAIVDSFKVVRLPKKIEQAPLPPGAMVEVIRLYQADLRSLEFKYTVPLSPTGYERLRQFCQQQFDQLSEIDFSSLSQDDKIDYLLLKNLLGDKLSRMEVEHQKDQAILELIPFWETIVALVESKANGDPIEGPETAETLQRLINEIAELSMQLSQSDKPIDSDEALRAAARVDELSTTLSSWNRFYQGYDPLFSWWVKAPFADAQESLGGYASRLRQIYTMAEYQNRTEIAGEPIGREALIKALAFEMIPYSPAELVEIANREFAWCDAEMEKAARELGFGDDWRAAQNFVKNKYVQPGEQPRLIRELAEEAIEFVEERDLVTVPPICKETWRMRMMSPERQKMSPYFLGGRTILVSYPTDTMEHADKLMSLRGNNPHFARATVHHELIPGHHLQGFMQGRYRPYRRLFATPFWLEGWALYWEMRLWDLDFAKSPEDRIGMLFWRKHRCARIIFSLSYHLNEMSADECIDFLVERVGHERNNATAEVRRSIEGGYGPLYQAAYMLGGLQIRALHHELVESGKMTEREFHDAILKQNSIPIEMLRARLTDQALTPEFESSWRFAD